MSGDRSRSRLFNRSLVPMVVFSGCPIFFGRVPDPAAVRSQDGSDRAVNALAESRGQDRLRRKAASSGDNDLVRGKLCH